MSRSYIALLLILTGCPAAKTTVIGTACKTTSNCNVAGQTCVNGICTHGCGAIFGDNGCPVGYDCYAVSGSTDLTCNQATYSVDTTTGVPLLFGKDCSMDMPGQPSACAGTGDANPSPQCRVGQDPSSGMPLSVDPAAYCTGTCTVDTDCPYNFFCAKDFDGVTKCLKREACAPCVYDDQCFQPGHAMEFYCVPPDNPSLPMRPGATHYCAKRCSNMNDCPGAAGGIVYTQCLPATSSTGLTTGFCLHRYGACVGQGEICDPCRTNDDCAKTNTKCITNTNTGEQMCTKRCTTDPMCAGPNNATCETMVYGLCTGDPMHQFGGQFTCWGNNAP
jgi:hypothetical protein